MRYNNGTPLGVREMTSIIIAHIDYEGKFVNKTDTRYQMINWTDEYILFADAMTEDSKDVRAEFKGTLAEMNALFDRLKDYTVYMTIRQVRILGDGSKDSNVVRYKTTGHCVPKGFSFEEVA